MIEQAIANRKPNSKDPIDLLSKIGGLEIAGMAGAMLAAASHRVRDSCCRCEGFLFSNWLAAEGGRSVACTDSAAI